jgi:hypothetical protein
VIGIDFDKDDSPMKEGGENDASNIIGLATHNNILENENMNKPEN